MSWRIQPEETWHNRCPYIAVVHMEKTKVVRCKHRERDKERKEEIPPPLPMRYPPCEARKCPIIVSIQGVKVEK